MGEVYRPRAYAMVYTATVLLAVTGAKHELSILLVAFLIGTLLLCRLLVSTESGLFDRHWMLLALSTVPVILYSLFGGSWEELKAYVIAYSVVLILYSELNRYYIKKDHRMEREELNNKQTHADQPPAGR